MNFVEFRALFGTRRWGGGTRTVVMVVPQGPHRAPPPITRVPPTPPPSPVSGHPVHHGSSQRFTRLLFVTTPRVQTRSSQNSGLLNTDYG